MMSRLYLKSHGNGTEYGQVSKDSPCETVHTTPKKFQNTPFLRFFFSFTVDTNLWTENEAFWKRWRHDNHVISLTEFSSNTNPNWITADCCVFKFLQRSVDEKHLMRFQSENSVFKFLRHSVDELEFISYVICTTYSSLLKRHYLYCTCLLLAVRVLSILFSSFLLPIKNQHVKLSQPSRVSRQCIPIITNGLEYFFTSSLNTEEDNITEVYQTTKATSTSDNTLISKLIRY